jgi:hypothetical protein
MADVLRTPCGVPIPVDVATPTLPEKPGLAEIAAMYGIWVPMREPPTVCPLVVDEADAKASGGV